jgi:DNA-binding GntR family transcriptional regulator
MATARDPNAARAALAALAHAIDTRHLARWSSLEVEFHRAVDDQCGNQVLAAMAERTLHEGLTACPILSLDVLRALQSHHQDIVRCVERGAADAAVRHTQAHLAYLRDVLVDAAWGSTCARIGLHP